MALTSLASFSCFVPALYTLHLEGNNLTQCDFPSEASFPSLVTLYLNHNQLESIARLTYAFPKLMTLDCQYNKIKRLNTWRGDLPVLSQLYLNHNRLENLTFIFPMPALYILNGESNHIQHIYLPQSRNPSLAILNLCTNNVSSAQYVHIGSSRCINIDVTNNQITHLHEYLAILHQCGWDEFLGAHPYDTNPIDHLTGITIENYQSVILRVWYDYERFHLPSDQLHLLLTAANELFTLQKQNISLKEKAIPVACQQLINLSI